MGNASRGGERKGGKVAIDTSSEIMIYPALSLPSLPSLPSCLSKFKNGADVEKVNTVACKTVTEQNLNLRALESQRRMRRRG